MTAELGQQVDQRTLVKQNRHEILWPVFVKKSCGSLSKQEKQELYDLTLGIISGELDYDLCLLDKNEYDRRKIQNVVKWVTDPSTLKGSGWNIVAKEMKAITTDLREHPQVVNRSATTLDSKY